MALGWKEKAKECLLLCIFSIGLPTYDAFFDLYFSIIAIMGGHYRWGFSLLAPVLLNLSFTAFTWWKMDQGKTWTENRKWTWLLLILMVWPQWRAANLLFSIVIQGGEEALESKKEFERRVGGLEPFLESTPQVCKYAVFEFFTPPRDPTHHPQPLIHTLSGASCYVFR